MIWFWVLVALLVVFLVVISPRKGSIPPDDPFWDNYR